MNRTLTLATAATAAMLISGAALAQNGSNDQNETMQPQQAKVTQAQAAEIALKAQPGTIASQELEKENGGSGLRYSFDITTKNGKTHEVGVDAQSGQVLENSIEGPNPD